MKKILAILPILLVAGVFTFATDSYKDQPKQEAAVMHQQVDPGGGGW